MPRGAERRRVGPHLRPLRRAALHREGPHRRSRETCVPGHRREAIARHAAPPGGRPRQPRLGTAGRRACPPNRSSHEPFRSIRTSRAREASPRGQLPAAGRGAAQGTACRKASGPRSRAAALGRPPRRAQVVPETSCSRLSAVRNWLAIGATAVLVIVAVDRAPVRPGPTRRRRRAERCAPAAARQRALDRRAARPRRRASPMPSKRPATSVPSNC